MSQSYYCKHCNTQNDSDDIYCAKCGRKLSHTDQTETSSDSLIGNIAEGIFYLIITIIVVIILYNNPQLFDHLKGVGQPSTNTSSYVVTATPYTAPVYSSSPTRKPTSSVIGQYCRINDPGANVRSGPSTNYSKIGIAPNNNWYLIVDYDRENTSKDWYKINMDGTYCWIYSELVELDGNTNGTTDGKPVSKPNSNSTSNTVSIIGETCYIFDDGNNVRTGPGTNYSIIGQVNSGASFKIYDYEICTTGKKPRDWYKIYFNGQYGWISSGIVDLHGHRDGTAYGVRVYD